MQFEGVFTALVTPFKNGQVDEDSFRNLLDHQLAGGVQGLVFNGTTAESPTLTKVEKEKLFKILKEKVAGKVPVLVGTGTNATASTIELTKEARDWGADGALVVVPYYNKPPQRGLVEHFKMVAAATPELPIMLYNVPSRTVTSLAVDSVVELSKIKNIVGIKEATGDIAFLSSLIERVGNGFTFSSGDDGTYHYFLEAGGHGLISVISNLLPKETVEIYEAHKKGDSNKGGEKFSKLMKTIDAISYDSNPIPIKAALEVVGVIGSDEVRLPLAGSTPEQLNRLVEELKSSGVVS